MKKLSLKNPILDVILGSILMLAFILEGLGLLGKAISPEGKLATLNYVLAGLQYVTGAVLLIFLTINLIISIKKEYHFWPNFIYIVGNGLIFTIALFLFFEPNQVKFPSKVIITPSMGFGLSLYIEGVILILSSAILNRKFLNALLGILVLTFGVVSAFVLRDEHIVYLIESVFFVFGLLYLLYGSLNLGKKNKDVKEEDTSEEKVEENSSSEEENTLNQDEFSEKTEE